jgi:lipopolysaccharide export system permease protein
VKIINRYVLKEHFGPFVFALSALTSLLLLQYIARRFGDLVGKGLSWQIITEFFLLSIPFTLAMTLPMAVLVAVLYAFSRLASENEITALKAGGVSTRSLLGPTLVAATFLAIGMLWFNDQILSRANHELATLQMAIIRTKPTFALKPQIINAVKEGQLYLSADQINQDESGRMTGVTIFDVSDGARRRSIYADSGKLSFASNKRDLIVHLYKGMMMSAPTDKPTQLSRIYYQQDIQKVRDVANSIDIGNADTTQKGEREMTVCEMQNQFELKDRVLQRALADSLQAAWRLRSAHGEKLPYPKDPVLEKAGGIGAAYCKLISKYFHVRTASAAEVPRYASQNSVPRAQQPAQQDSVKKASQDSAKKASQQDSTKKGSQSDSARRADSALAAAVHAAAIKPAAPGTFGVDAKGKPVNAMPAPNVVRPIVPVPPSATAHVNPQVDTTMESQNASKMEINDAKMRLDEARHWRNRYGVEIQKKFSLAFACIVFVLVGAPIALRFPRGGVGLVMGVGFLVFAIYYIGLIGGESLANKNIVSPFVAMWIDNIVFLIIGLVLVALMGNENTTSRGGQFAERVDAVRAWFQRVRGARA